jgi:hypothetical protein
MCSRSFRPRLNDAYLRAKVASEVSAQMCFYHRKNSNIVVALPPNHAIDTSSTFQHELRKKIPVEHARTDKLGINRG